MRGAAEEKDLCSTSPIRSTHSEKQPAPHRQKAPTRRTCVVWLWNDFRPWTLRHFFLCGPCATFRLLSSWHRTLSTAVCCVLIACLWLKLHHVKLRGRVGAVCGVIRKAPPGGMRAKGLNQVIHFMFWLAWMILRMKIRYSLWWRYTSEVDQCQSSPSRRCQSQIVLAAKM